MAGKYSDIWKLSNTFINNMKARNIIPPKMLKYYELNESENTIY